VFLAPVAISFADAQQTPPTPSASPTASAVGTVFDSIRFRPMSGARVQVDSSDLVVTADETGRFHIEGIPPGVHRLRVEHPVIDTLGVGLRSETAIYAAGETKASELATPTAESLIAMLCSPAWRARGPAALMGRVREADSGMAPCHNHTAAATTATAATATCTRAWPCSDVEPCANAA